VTLALWTVGAVVVLVTLSAWRSRRELSRWLGRDPFAVRRIARALLIAAATGAVAWAWVMAQQMPPRFADGGLDVVMAIDVSRSMDAEDTAPSRLRRALRFAERLVLETEGARMALLIFAGDAYVSLPLTLDRDAHLVYLAALDSDVISNRGSDLNRALSVAADVFDPRSPRPRVLVLMTDGEHEGSSLEDVLLRLRGDGIRVVSVGFGTLQGDIVPGPRGGPLFDRRGNAIISRRGDGILERLAHETGGSYVREFEDAPEPAALLPSASELASNSTTPEPGPFQLLALLALIALLVELWLSTQTRLSWRWAWRRAARPATALLTLLLLGCPDSWVQEGDLLLGEGDPQEALSLYRRHERAYGTHADTQIRIGNALYRLDLPDRSAASYLEALRKLGVEDRDERFVASFNLGNTLLLRERFTEARDPFWTALLERPDSIAAKFNYEWALSHSEPEPELPPAPPDPENKVSGSGQGEGGESDEEGEADGMGAKGSRQVERELPPRAAPTLNPEEARRWLETIEDSMETPLRRQVTEELGAGPLRPPGGQTW
jgi:Ca-activated chloride channel family protein